MSAALLYDFNHARLWRRSVSLWDRRVRAPSLDRLLFLTLHRLGWMGAEEVRLLRRLVLPGMRVVDVGANVGLYSLLLSELVGESGRVYSFEPEPQLLAALQENCVANGISNIVPFGYAAGAAKARATFQRSSFNSGNNRLGRARGHGTVLEVDVVKIDDVVPTERVDFAKIDVQGHELGALQGMERLLSASPRVRVFFEFWPAGLVAARTAAEELLGFFEERGFILYRTEGAKLQRIADSSRFVAGFSGSGYTNLLASRAVIDV